MGAPTVGGFAQPFNPAFGNLHAPPLPGSDMGGGGWSATIDDAHPLLRNAAAAREAAAEEMGGAAADLSMRATYA